jgi:hypothetical protein
MKVRMKRLTLVFCAILALIPSLRGEAQVLSEIYQKFASYFSPDPNSGLTAFRSLLIPMGGVAEGMGQAYTAVSRDSSYFESNPAASSVLDQTELAVYHNNWIADSKVEGAVYTIRTGNFGMGILGKWLYLPFPQTDDFGTRVSDSYYAEAIGGLNISYNFFQGYNFSGISLGASLKGAYRSMPPGVTAAGQSSAGALMLDLGSLIRFNFLKFYAARAKNVAFGLALKNLGPPVQGDPLPTLASAGLAYSPFRPLVFAFDFSQPVNLADFSKSEKPSWAFGLEGNLTEFFKLYAGFLLKQGKPRISLGTSFYIDLMRLSVNYTLDLTTQFTAGNRISVEAAFSLGDLGRADLAKKVDILYLKGLEAYASGDSAAASAAWEEAIKLDPRFDPAIESLKALKGTQDLLKSIDELQKLD